MVAVTYFLFSSFWGPRRFLSTYANKLVVFEFQTVDICHVATPMITVALLCCQFALLLQSFYTFLLFGLSGSMKMFYLYTSQNKLVLAQLLTLDNGHVATLNFLVALLSHQLCC